MRKQLLLICSFIGTTAFAQKLSYTDRANAYIQQYASWAVEEQQRSGVPAAITLAQGIYETSAGESELATKANNHFGIKCKKEWRGETFAHTDDAPNECFRKYSSAKDSYKDHSDYLKNSPRYAALFELEQTNYVAWASGLKRCGYATNPQYAQKLIKMVEDFSLQEYTLSALNQRPDEIIPVKERTKPAITALANAEMKAEPRFASVAAVAAEPSPADPVEGVQLVNGLKAIYCHKGETLLDKAMKYNVRYARLLEINELADEPLRRDMFIYLERKNAKGAHATYTVAEGETVELIAHNEGMNTRQLRVFNLLAQNEQPVAGSVLKLQEQSDTRPVTYTMTQSQAQQAASRTGTIKLVDPAAKNANEAYVTTHSKTVNAVEEVEIGYGAERPASLQETTPAIPAEKAAAEPRVLEQQMTGDKPASPQVTPVQQEAEPQDELSRLKARLDKAVYSGSAPNSNMKVSSSDPGPVMGPPAKAETPARAASKNSEGEQFHTVQKGDTGYSIARKYNISMKQLREWNGLNFEGIKIGQKLKVK